jgi:hypothetical protein
MLTSAGSAVGTKNTSDCSSWYISGPNLTNVSGCHDRLAAQNERQANFRVAVLGRVQIQHERHQRPLQPRARTGVQHEARAGQFGATPEIHQTERLAQIPVWPWLKGKNARLVTGRVQDRGVVFAARVDRIQRRVGQLQQQVVLRLVQFPDLRLARLNFRLQFGRTGEQIVGVLAGPFALRDLRADLVLLGLEVFKFRQARAPLLVNTQQRLNGGHGCVVAAFCQGVAHGVGFGTNTSNVEHSEECLRCENNDGAAASERQIRRAWQGRNGVEMVAQPKPGVNLRAGGAHCFVNGL